VSGPFLSNQDLSEFAGSIWKKFNAWLIEEIP